MTVRKKIEEWSSVAVIANTYKKREREMLQELDRIGKCDCKGRPE